jgi:hypothetical protein
MTAKCSTFLVEWWANGHNYRNYWYIWVSITNLLTNFPGAETWAANTSSASQQIPRTSWNPKVHTAFTSARHLPLPWAIAIQSTPPRRTSCRSVLMLSLHLGLGLTSGLFTSRHTWWLRLHRDLKMEMVTTEIRRFARRHEERLLHHNVEVIQMLDNTELLRRLKRIKPFELVSWTLHPENRAA